MMPAPADPPDVPDRLALLRDWLQEQLPEEPLDLEPASADASFRRYFRIRRGDGSSLIAMDAPPAQENCQPFLHVAALLHEAGVNVPLIRAQDTARGFLLLSDLGGCTYLDQLRQWREDTGASHSGDIDHLYRDALEALVTIQQADLARNLPDYDRALLMRELRLFPEWYVAKQLGITLSSAQQAVLHAAFAAIVDNNLAQPRVFVHRDYHSRNLMVCSPNPGILDFQDAVHGPLTYDLVSLLRDAYVAWEEALVIEWCVRYWEAARRAGLPVAADFAVFYRDFEWMGVQRQLKVVGIFARLAFRDGKRGYLGDQPRVLGYLLATCRRYRDLGGLARLLDQLAAHGAAASQ